MPAGDRRPIGASSGFTYVGLLVAVALLGISLAAVGTVWSQRSRRERESELIRVGAAYAEAIRSYYRLSPGAMKRYPPSLEALLSDTRFLGTTRHLRELYADPVAPKLGWGLVRAPDGGVRGVYSRSLDVPLRVVAIEIGMVFLPAARRYADWQFIARVD